MAKGLRKGSRVREVGSKIVGRVMQAETVNNKKLWRVQWPGATHTTLHSARGLEYEHAVCEVLTHSCVAHTQEAAETSSLEQAVRATVRIPTPPTPIAPAQAAAAAVPPASALSAKCDMSANDEIIDFISL